MQADPYVVLSLLLVSWQHPSICASILSPKRHFHGTQVCRSFLSH